MLIVAAILIKVLFDMAAYDLSTSFFIGTEIRNLGQQNAKEKRYKAALPHMVVVRAVAI